MAGHVSLQEGFPTSEGATHSAWQRALHHGRQAIYTLSTVALLVASAIMTYGVIVRHVAGIALIWQDEVCIFLLVGATFLSAASVQAHRGHVGIEAIVGFLSPAVNRARMILCDLLCALFCGFFTWKAGRLLEEAFLEGQTSASPWGPPLWIPYGLMTLGMFFLTFQFVIQVIEGVSRRRPGAKA